MKTAAGTPLDLESQIYLNAETLTEGRLGDSAGQWQVIGEDFAEDLLKKLAE